MKQAAAVLLIACFSSIFFSCSNTKQIQNSSSPEEIRSGIQNNRWVFNATNANPQAGRTRFLSPPDRFYLKGDTLISELSYFGQAYAGADVMSNQSPLNFRYTDFSISKQQNAKGAWIISIRPKDNNAVQNLVFTLYESGNSLLNVTMTSRSSISFNGYPEALK
jgi:hypothetical protein